MWCLPHWALQTKRMATMFSCAEPTTCFCVAQARDQTRVRECVVPRVRHHSIGTAVGFSLLEAGRALGCSLRRTDGVVRRPFSSVLSDVNGGRKVRRMAK